MRIKRLGKRDVTRASAWVTYLLLAIGMLVPVVCVVWLTRTAVENENAVVRQLVEEARYRKLEDAERLIRESLEKWGEEVSAIGVIYQTRPADTEDLGEEERVAVRRLLRDARNMAKEQNPSSFQAWAADKLLSDQMALRFSGQRHVGPVILEMALDTVSENQALSPDFLQAADAYVRRYLESAAPVSQKRYLLNRYAPHSESEWVATRAARERVVADWQSALMERGGYPPADGIGTTQKTVFAWNEAKGQALIIDRDRFIEYVSGQGGLIGGSIEARLGPPEDEDAMSKRMDAPLSFLWLTYNRMDPVVDVDTDRALIYVWIGAIVLGLSVVTGAAIVYSLRRQASVTALKDNLVATVTHELKTPVSSIRLLVDTLMDPVSKERVDTGEYLELISRENQRLGRLIDNFLSFSRMERNKASFSIEPIEAEDVARSAETVFRERFSGQPFELTVDVEQDIPRLAGDKDALVTVLGNLLENALKYGGAGKKIELRAQALPQHVAFSVRDWGRGIARRERSRIFRKFYRAEPEQVDSVGSVGLGLAIVSFIVSKHSGHVSLESEVGEGSAFTIRIPYA